MSVKGTYVPYLSFTGNKGFVPEYSHYKRPLFPLKKTHRAVLENVVT